MVLWDVTKTTAITAQSIKKFEIKEDNKIGKKYYVQVFLLDGGLLDRVVETTTKEECEEFIEKTAREMGL